MGVAKREEEGVRGSGARAAHSRFPTNPSLSFLRKENNHRAEEARLPIAVVN